MPKRNPNTKNYNVETMQPDEINSLRSLVKEFISKIESIDNEIELLKGDRKEIIEEYTEKLDMKTLQAALRVVKIQQAIEHKDTYDLFLEALTGVERSE
jgi:uncharacterized protein (UPF0335 family)